MLCQGVTKLNKSCPWKAKPNCNGFCKAHKACVPVRKEEDVETEHFLNEAKECLYASPDPSALPFPTKFVKLNLMDKIEKLLWTVKETKQYRDKIKKAKFNQEVVILVRYRHH